jgi:hypothetical protein
MFEYMKLYTGVLFTLLVGHVHRSPNQSFEMYDNDFQFVVIPILHSSFFILHSSFHFLILFFIPYSLFLILILIFTEYISFMWDKDRFFLIWSHTSQIITIINCRSIIWLIWDWLEECWFDCEWMRDSIRGSYLLSHNS